MRSCSKCSQELHPTAFPPKGRICIACIKSQQRNLHLIKTYGISEIEYDKLFKAQGGRCAVCDKTSVSKLHVDHDHATGVIRGLLCFFCNRYTLCSRNSPARLRAAVRYLDSPPAPRVLGARIVPKKKRKR